MSKKSYDDWPAWRLRLAFVISWLWPGNSEWQAIAPVLERKTAERRRT